MEQHFEKEPTPWEKVSQLVGSLEDVSDEVDQDIEENILINSFILKAPEEETDDDKVDDNEEEEVIVEVNLYNTFKKALTEKQADLKKSLYERDSALIKTKTEALQSFVTIFAESVITLDEIDSGTIDPILKKLHTRYKEILNTLVRIDSEPEFHTIAN